MKMTMVLRFADDPRQLTECLAHEARLQADRHPDCPFDLLLRYEGCDRVDDNHIDRALTRDSAVESLLALSGWRSKLFRIDPEVMRIDRVECMLSIDECGDAAHLLQLLRSHAVPASSHTEDSGP